VIFTEFTVLSTTVQLDEVDRGSRRWSEFIDGVCVHGRASGTGACARAVQAREFTQLKR